MTNGFAGKETSYSDREVCALIAPLLGCEPDDLGGGVILGVTKEGQVRMAANLTVAGILQVLSEAGMQAIYAGMPAPDHEHDAEGNCIFPEDDARAGAGTGTNNPLEGVSVDDLVAELGITIDPEGDGKE